MHDNKPNNNLLNVDSVSIQYIIIKISKKRLKKKAKDQAVNNTNTINMLKEQQLKHQS